MANILNLAYMEYRENRIPIFTISQIICNPQGGTNVYEKHIMGTLKVIHGSGTGSTIETGGQMGYMGLGQPMLGRPHEKCTFSETEILEPL